MLDGSLMMTVAERKYVFGVRAYCSHARPTNTMMEIRNHFHFERRNRRMSTMLTSWSFLELLPFVCISFKIGYLSLRLLMNVEVAHITELMDVMVDITRVAYWMPLSSLSFLRYLGWT